MDKFEALKQYFGYDRFRRGQEPLIDGVLSGRDVLGIMPTGGGKSLCYQLPAVLLEGITLVISPLIALMKDQVDGLNEMGIGAVFINSSLELEDIRARAAMVRQGQVRLLYVAPERLNTDGFLNLVRQAGISLIAVDEAHCISQWGHDFRPSYQEIPTFIRQLNPRPPVAAFTATATLRVVDEIRSMLDLNDPVTLTTGFDRPNLSYSVATPPNKYSFLKDFLNRQSSETTGIIYCATRKMVDGLTVKLQREGFSVQGYHGGMDPEIRRRVQDSFMQDNTRIIVATNAFGMGIDKPDVRFVVHYNMPGNMEAYYQEAGRAGRDGEPAACVLMYSSSDVINQKLILDNDGLEPHRKALMLENLQLLVNYCHTQECLRRTIRTYFGEADSAVHCGNCGNCNDNSEMADVTVAAQKILSCIYRVGQRFGVTMIIKVLKGSRDKKVLENRLDQVSTYGILADMPEGSIKEILMSLVAQEYVLMTADAYPVLKLRAEAKRVLNGEAQVMIQQHRIAVTRKSRKVKSQSSDSPTGSEGLYDRLVALRKRLAAQKGVPTYVIFHNKALDEMARLCPQSREEFMAISGVGERKYEAYGPCFAEVIAAYIGA